MQRFREGNLNGRRMLVAASLAAIATIAANEGPRPLRPPFTFDAYTA
jgi:hypothetical protein